LAGHPWIDRLFVFRHVSVRVGSGFISSIRRYTEQLALLTGELRTERWDVALDLQSAFKSSQILLKCGAQHRIAEMAGWRHIWAFAACNRPVLARNPHAVVRCLEVAAPLGVDASNPEFCLKVAPEAATWAQDRLREVPRPRLIVNPGSARKEKRWAPERFAEAVKAAHAAGVRAGVVVIGGPADLEAAAVIEEGLGGDCLNLAGQTGLRQLAALLAEGDLLLTADTGPMHMMAALGKSTVALFGPTDPARNGPWGKQHIVLRAPDGRMASLQSAEVGQAVARLLAERH